MKYQYLLAFIGAYFCCLVGCQSSDYHANSTESSMSQSSSEARSFLALGDSYTIGEKVSAEERWPVQLAKALGDSLRQPQIIAKTGWTTQELLEGIDSVESEGGLQEKYGLVSLLIGVNNQYRGQDTAVYRREFAELLDRAIGLSEHGAASVFIISIPDYGVTPFIEDKPEREPEAIAKELDWYNSAAAEIASSKGAAFADVTPISRRAAEDPTLIAEDGLHPSGKMYAAWVKEEILAVAREVLNKAAQDI